MGHKLKRFSLEENDPFSFSRLWLPVVLQVEVKPRGISSVRIGISTDVALYWDSSKHTVEIS